jgi:predicted ATP-dependent protease
MAARKSPAAARAPRALPASALRWSCPPGWIAPARRRRLTARETLFGQARALEALELGLALDAPGYNVFVCGIGGTDRAEIVVSLLRQMRLACVMPRDHVFVHNFDSPIAPKHLALPPGGAAALAEGMDRWVHALATEVPKLLRGKPHLARRHGLFRRYQKAESQLFQRLEKRLAAAGLALTVLEDEIGSRREVLMRVGDALCGPDKLAEAVKSGACTEERAAELSLARDRMLPEVEKAQHQARALGLRLVREARNLDESVVQEAVEGLTLALAEELGAEETLGAWLGDCARFALNNTRLFLQHQAREASGGDNEDGDEDAPPAPVRPGLEVFEVHVVRTLRDPDCPIVFEQHPNYSNLFGTVERHVIRGGPGHFHKAVRPGSLLSADGGFLVLNARDVFKEAEVWRALKRTLQNGRLAVHALEGLSPLGVTGARPEAIPIRVKVVLVGDEDLYESLHDQDFDFPHIFKVKADFDDSVPLDRESVGGLVHTLRDLGTREELLPFAREGLQALIERAVRDAGRRSRLSSRIAVIADFAREASYHALRAGEHKIGRAAVETARIKFREMHTLEAEWHQRTILEGVTLIETAGTRVGSVNALTVVRLGPMAFGRPARVSAMCGAGEEQYASVDREVELAGAIHNKGVLQVENVMRFRYGQERPLPAKLHVIFDQSYGPIDGDSASSTEFYAMVSALSGVPIRQEIAVTGAVGLRGELLAIGGVNEKIEGFFEVCRLRGLTGTQGVLIPEANVGDLMLPPEVIAAVAARRFHVWAAAHVDEGIALLTGRSAAAVDAKVRERLAQLQRAAKDEDDGKAKAAASPHPAGHPHPAPPVRKKRRRPRKGEREP